MNSTYLLNVFEPAELAQEKPPPPSRHGKRAEEEYLHFLRASAHTSIELRWSPLTPLAAHFPSRGEESSLPLDSDT